MSSLWLPGSAWKITLKQVKKETCCDRQILTGQAVGTKPHSITEMNQMKSWNKTKVIFPLGFLYFSPLLEAQPQLHRFIAPSYSAAVAPRSYPAAYPDKTNARIKVCAAVGLKHVHEMMWKYRVTSQLPITSWRLHLSLIHFQLTD